MTPPSATQLHLLIHYHRTTRPDYHNVQLLLLPPSDHAVAPTRYVQAREHSVTSFGAVFHVVLPNSLRHVPFHLLPFQHSLNHPHLPLKHVSSLDSFRFLPCFPFLHLFLVDHSSQVLPSPLHFNHPSSPRFLFLSTNTTAAATTPLSVHISSPALSHLYVYPASPNNHPPTHPLLYLIDLYHLPSTALLHLSLCPTLTISPSPTPSPQTPSLQLPALPQAHYLITSSSITPADVSPLPTLHSQALFKPSLSASFPLPRPLPNPIAIPLSQPPLPTPLPQLSHPIPPSVLYLHLHPLHNRFPNPPTSLIPTSANAPAIPLRHTTSSPVLRLLQASLSTLPSPLLHAGLRISHTPHIWTPSQGSHLVLTPANPLPQPPSRVDIRLYYHRLDHFPHLPRWRLFLSIPSTPSSQLPAISRILTPSPTPHPGLVFFNLSSAIFPPDVTLHAHLCRLSASAVEQPHLLQQQKQQQQHDIHSLKCDLRDVSRQWHTSKPLPSEIHWLQGDSHFHLVPPDRHRFVTHRYIRFTYRRFLPNDYEHWDLWTWDPNDPPHHRVVVPQHQDPSQAFATFVIDRAQYGAANSVSILPRCGGDEWTQKDDPIRIWHNTLLNNLQQEDSTPCFFITQTSPHVTTTLHELSPLLNAYPDSQTSLVLNTPIPIAWIYPPKPNCPSPAAATVLKIRSDASMRVHTLSNECVDADVAGKIIRVRKVQQVTPTQVRLFVGKDDVCFDEDFLVERVAVVVPGFDAVTMTWQRQDDWDHYFYDGSLGWQYSKEACSFRCFAPTADSVSLVLYDAPTGDQGRIVVPMRRISQGCWKVIVNRDLKGAYYKLLAEGENKRLFPGVEVIDPYSRCNTSHNGRGLIFGVESTKIAPRPNVKPSEAIVYEMHIRDLTIDENSGVSRRAKYCGVAERDTKMLGVSDVNIDKPMLCSWEQDILHGTTDLRMKQLHRLSTGLDHIVQMGVNTVQILPIQDFDNDETDDKGYHWGYMPVHFNSPDGWYASSTSSVARVTEFKLLVDAFHKAGLKVIMDVVYNHTSEDPNELNLDARFSFNGLAPRYFYRTCGNTPVAYTGDSTCGRRSADEARCGECYSNGSGCGNEFRSDSPMGRKFIIDSLKYWATEYQIDGFRFDLMGLIDVETMTQAAAELHKIDENIMLYGEPWCGGLSPMKPTEKGTQRSRGFGIFNDKFRDAIRGSHFDSEETFIMDGGRLADVKGGIIGSIDTYCDTPVESMNYVECHDNYTLWDHFRFYVKSRMDDIEYSEDDFRRMHRLAAVLILTSQGVPFIQCGQEMCRTKFDVENSYNSPDDINMIRWHNKVKEWATVCYYRGLIILRRAHPEIFCKESPAEIHDGVTFYEDLGLPVPDRCIAYRVLGDSEKLHARLQMERNDLSADEQREESLKWTEVLVMLNPTPSPVHFELPGADMDHIWWQVVDASHAGVRNVRGPFVGVVEVQGRSAAVLRRSSEKDTRDAQLMLRLDAVSDSYSIFQGDDPISRYSVGLEKTPSPEEVRERETWLEHRSQFNKRRASSKKN